MAANISASMPGMIEQFNSYVERTSDPRTKDLFMLGGLSPLITLLLVYNIFCIQIGPMLMRDRKPFELRKTLIVYNALNVLGSIYAFNEGLQSGWLEYSFVCQPVDYSYSPQALRMTRACHFYFLTKLVELLDTVFFVLRKKGNQITFLHLFHHTLMPLAAWTGTKFYPGGHGTFLGMVNSLVHIVMYTYYMLAAMGPQYQKYLWWKRYLTVMQIVQFAMILAHQIPQYLFTCDFPKEIVVLLTLLSAFFIYLFGSFYVKTYSSNSSSSSSSSSSNNSSNKKLKVT